MSDRASAAPMLSSPAPPRPSAALSWAERLMLRVLRLPTIEEAERILRDRPGFFASLTPEQRATLDAYDGPEVLGPANGPKRNF